MPFAIAIPLALAVAGLAWWGGALTRAGAGAATLVGAAILGGTGWIGGAALLMFFMSSTIVSRLVPDPTAALLDPRDHRRTPWQVLANGGVAALGGVIGLGVPGVGIWVVTSALAAAAADTWATAWGARASAPPRNIGTGRRVPPGSSGGVTLLGTVGGIVGGMLVAATAAWLAGDPRLWGAGLVGFLGMVADSVLGAVGQGKFVCPQCGSSTERRIHRCGTPTVRVSGLAWLSNDGVNALATAFAALGGWLLWYWAR